MIIYGLHTHQFFTDVSDIKSKLKIIDFDEYKSKNINLIAQLKCNVKIVKEEFIKKILKKIYEYKEASELTASFT